MSRIVAAAFALFWVAPLASHAEEFELDVVVNCDPASVNQLRAAVVALRDAGRLDGPNVITVNGLCHETGPVPIDQFERLTIQAGPAGGGIASTSTGAAVRIFNSRDVTLSGLDISGATRVGLNITSSTQDTASSVFTSGM